MNKKADLKGPLRLYMRWPFYLTILLVGMCVAVYLANPTAGIVAALFVLVYAVIAGALYLRNRSAIYKEMVSFATQYGQIQKTLLRDLAIPYALIGTDGKLIWMNQEFMSVTGKIAGITEASTQYFPS